MLFTYVLFFFDSPREMLCLHQSYIIFLVLEIMLGMRSDIPVELLCEDFSSVEIYLIAYLNLSNSAINTILL